MLTWVEVWRRLVVFPSSDISCSSTKSRKFKILLPRLPDPGVSFLLGNKDVLQLLPHHFNACLPKKKTRLSSCPACRKLISLHNAPSSFNQRSILHLIELAERKMPLIYSARANINKNNNLHEKW